MKEKKENLIFLIFQKTGSNPSVVNNQQTRFGALIVDYGAIYYAIFFFPKFYLLSFLPFLQKRQI